MALVRKFPVTAAPPKPAAPSHYESTASRLKPAPKPTMDEILGPDFYEERPAYRPPTGRPGLEGIEECDPEYGAGGAMACSAPGSAADMPPADGTLTEVEPGAGPEVPAEDEPADSAGQGDHQMEDAPGTGALAGAEADDTADGQEAPAGLDGRGDHQMQGAPGQGDQWPDDSPDAPTDDAAADEGVPEAAVYRAGPHPSGHRES